MQIIEVVFPTPPAGTKPVVVGGIARGTSFEDVTWDFVSCNPHVDYVEVEFADAKDTFFAGAIAPNTPTKYGKKLKNGKKAFIFGEVPEYKGKSDPVQAKYTVRGYDKAPDKGGTLVAELDPLFVTDKP